MDKQDNLPIKLATNSVVANIGGGGSLVGRGLAALRKDNDALYRQARVVFDRRTGWHGIRSWNVADNPDISSAFKIFQQLASENYGKAYYPLSILYTDKRDIEEGQDRAQHFAQMAFDWCFANQANQDVELWCDLGEMYREGRGVEQNDEKAVYWFRKSAEQGNAYGQSELGSMYSKGSGVERNDEQAVYWFRKATEQDNAIGQWQLGMTYNCGQGVEQNDEQAVYWFRKAAEQGYVMGQWWLGMAYYLGCGVERNDEQAVYWYRKEAEQGHALGQSELGDMYLRGHGVKQNDEQAVYWLRKAAEQGWPKAQEALRELGIDWKK